MSDVAIKGGWDSNDSGRNSLAQEVLSQVASISHGVGGSNQNDTGNLMLLADFTKLFEVSLEQPLLSLAKIVAATEVSVRSK
jgi:hypothetical protein